MDQPKPPNPAFTIKVDDEVAKGRFANLAQVGTTNEVFVLDFAFLQGPSGWLLSRILMSPSHAKRFLHVLTDTIARYEERFGKIETGPTLQ